MWDLILIVITLIVLLIASYSDLRTREVPDWLSYSLIFGALGIRLIFSLNTFDWSILLNGAIGLAVCIALAYLFYYSGQWGGGDSKLLMGMGAVIGIEWPLSNASLNLLWFFLALLFLGSIYGLVWMGGISVVKRKNFVPIWKNKQNKQRGLFIFALACSLALLGLILLSPALWFFSLLPIGLYYLFSFVSAVEDSCFYNKVSPEKLVEGDWLGEAVKIGDKTIVVRKTLEAGDVSRLKQLFRDGKLKWVTIKEGVPFVPSFLFAYLALFFLDKLLKVVLNI